MHLVLAERQAELGRIDDVLARARGGAGSTLVIEGPAGIGKTALLRSAADLAVAAGMRCLTAVGTPLESDYAAGVIRQLLEPSVRAADDLDSLFAGAAGLARTVLFDLADQHEATPGGVLHGLYWLVGNLAASSPMVIAVDDCHWADEASLRFLAYLARRVESLPVALLVGTRPRNDESAAAGVLGELLADRSTGWLQLKPLSPAGVVEVLRASTGDAVDPEFARMCCGATGGNPFLLSELARELRARGMGFSAADSSLLAGVTPPTVVQRVRLTLHRIGPDARALARAVAVLGEDTDVAVASTLAGLSAERASATSLALVAAGLFDDSVRLRFAHPLLADAVRSDMPAGDRAVAHAAAAELLKSRGASPERVALQLLHVEPAGSPVIVEDLRAAAAVARGRGAATTEVTLLARALCEPPTPEVRLPLLLDLAQCEYATGRTADAAGHYDEARRNAKDPVTQARALIGLFQSRSGEFSAQRAMAADLEAALPTVLETDRELGLLVWTLLLLAVEPGRGWQRVASGVEGLRGDTPGEALLVGHAMLPIVNPTVTAAELSVVSAQAERHAAALVERGATSLVMTGIVLGLLWTDDCRQAERLLTDAADIAQRHGALQDLALIYQFLAICRLRDGRLLDAEADARTAAAISVGEGWAGAGTRAAAPLAHSLLDQGRVEDARRELADLGDGRIPDAPAMTTVLIARMRLRSALGRHGAALDDWTEALARAERHFGGVNSSWVPDLLIAAEVHHAAGETRERDALVGRASELAEQWGTPGFRGAVRSRLARFGRREDAIALSAEGIELLRTSPARLELATALVAHGQLLRRAGQPSDSRDPLREGYELARLCGAQPLAETARTELRASGVRLRREALTGVDSLTASERRVADLAARGLSNAEIAQRQFLTVKTIEGHLSRAYRKLDISNRADLPRALTGKDKGDGQGSSP